MVFYAVYRSTHQLSQGYLLEFGSSIHNAKVYIIQADLGVMIIPCALKPVLSNFLFYREILYYNIIFLETEPLIILMVIPVAWCRFFCTILKTFIFKMKYLCDIILNFIKFIFSVHVCRFQRNLFLFKFTLKIVYLTGVCVFVLLC